MNAKTLEAIKRHGETLLRAFPNATEKNPVALCKKLRRIETAVAKPILDYCNGDNGMTEPQLSTATDKALSRLSALLEGCKVMPWPVFINCDPRGYALKIESDWTQRFNRDQYAAKLPALHTDMGGYGIIAPDLTVGK